MLAKLIRLFFMFILEKLGLVNSREVEDRKEQKGERFWEDDSFWKKMAGRGDTSKTVDGTWREVREDEEEKRTGPEPDFSSDSTSSSAPDPTPDPSSEPRSLQEKIRELSKAAEEIRHSGIREQAFHVLILARDIIYEHDTGHSKSRNYAQFENYYVPTLSSVINNYCSIEAKGMATAKMKNDVLSYLESCGDAFTKMYNNMFSDDILKMEVEMEAMDIILKRDGLL